MRSVVVGISVYNPHVMHDPPAAVSGDIPILHPISAIRRKPPPPRACLRVSLMYNIRIPMYIRASVQKCSGYIESGRISTDYDAVLALLPEFTSGDSERGICRREPHHVTDCHSRDVGVVFERDHSSIRNGPGINLHGLRGHGVDPGRDSKSSFPSPDGSRRLHKREVAIDARAMGGAERGNRLVITFVSDNERGKLRLLFCRNRPGVFFRGQCKRKRRPVRPVEAKLLRFRLSVDLSNDAFASYLSSKNFFTHFQPSRILFLTAAICSSVIPAAVIAEAKTGSARSIS